MADVYMKLVSPENREVIEGVGNAPSVPAMQTVRSKAKNNRDVNVESGGRDSNPRPSAWEAETLPAELPPQCGKPLFYRFRNPSQQWLLYTFLKNTGHDDLQSKPPQLGEANLGERGEVRMTAGERACNDRAVQDTPP